MNRKYWIVIGMLFIIALGGAGYLVRQALRKREINVLNWNDYVGKFTNRDFQDAFRVRVNTKYYISNEVAYSLVASHRSTYDVIFPSDYMINQLIHEDKLERINSPVSNFNSAIIDQRAINEFRAEGWDQYCVPYLHGNTGFAVNTKLLGRMPEDVSWKWLASTEFSGKMIIIDDARQVLGSVLIELGRDANSVKESDLSEAVNLLRSLRGKIVEFTGDSIKESARAGIADVAFAWSGDALQLEGDLSNWKYALPRAGGIRFQDGVCIVKSAPHKDMAVKYLNFLLDPKIHTDILETTLYPTTNRAARELASARYRKIERTASEDDVKTQRLKDLGPQGLDAIRNAWEKVKR
jgi:spermidine/putrescine transport system substrate-binding protein